MDDEIIAGDRVMLLEPNPDAGRIAVVRWVDVGGAFVQLLGTHRCFVWVGASSLAKHGRTAGTRQAPRALRATRPPRDRTPRNPDPAA